jgi:hypothetical protein
MQILSDPRMPQGLVRCYPLIRIDRQAFLNVCKEKNKYTLRKSRKSLSGELTASSKGKWRIEDYINRDF